MTLICTWNYIAHCLFARYNSRQNYHPEFTMKNPQSTTLNWSVGTTGAGSKSSRFQLHLGPALALAHFFWRRTKQFLGCGATGRAIEFHLPVAWICARICLEYWSQLTKKCWGNDENGRFTQQRKGRFRPNFVGQWDIPHWWWVFRLNMVMFHTYVGFQEGSWRYPLSMTWILAFFSFVGRSMFAYPVWHKAFLRP